MAGGRSHCTESTDKLTVLFWLVLIFQLSDL